MVALRKRFGQYTGFLRRLKLVYVINNLLNIKHLRRNKVLFQKYGVKKPIWASIGSHDFNRLTNTPQPWLDQPDALEQVRKHPDFHSFTPELQTKIIQFIQEGYIILEGFFDQDAVRHHNDAIDQLLQHKQVDFNYTGRKLMEAYKYDPFIESKFFKNPELLRLLQFLMGKPIIPFHTINFIYGSEQRAHSDSIHMTTYPQGYLIAAWFALEDCSPENGTIFYYPKSHRLPYVTHKDYPSGNTKWLIGAQSNRFFEDHIEKLVQEHQLEKKQFHAKKGDVFIWHAKFNPWRVSHFKKRKNQKKYGGALFL